MLSVPAQKQTNPVVLSEFKGVDFTSKVVSETRSPNAYNFVNNNGYIESRNGYKLLATIGTRINGVWNVDTGEGDRFIVHSGNKIYQASSDFTEFTEIITGAKDERSSAIYMQGQLFIFDGNRAIVYGKFGADYQAKFVDEAGYIPTTKIQMKPSGGGESLEDINMIQKYRINTFLGTKDDRTYQLNEKGLSTDEVFVEKLTADGWVTLKENTDFTVDREKGQVTFTTAPGETPLAQEDNVKIRYAKENQEYFDTVNKSDLITSYGYDGNNNRIFIAKDNYVYYSEAENPYFFPDLNYIKIGQEPIVNFIRTNDGVLGVQKKLSDTDATIYYLTSAIYNNKEVFTLSEGVKTLGCISKYANANLVNDSLTLTEQGVYAVVSTNDEKYAMQRDYFVNKRLMSEPNLQNAYGIAVNGRYYLAVNGNVYIADNTQKAYMKYAKTEQYQYEWYFWNNIPARILFRWENKLFFGTEDGKIYGFEGYQDDGVPTKCYYETCLLDLGTSSKTKTIKNLTLIVEPDEDVNVLLGYKLEDGTYDVIEYESSVSEFPKIIQEKEKIRKFMYIKFTFENEKNKKMSFKELNIDYVLSGKYRG